MAIGLSYRLINPKCVSSSSIDLLSSDFDISCLKQISDIKILTCQQTRIPLERNRLMYFNRYTPPGNDQHVENTQPVSMIHCPVKGESHRIESFLTNKAVAANARFASKIDNREVFSDA